MRDWAMLFCFRNTILSEAIREIDGGEYSHVAYVRRINGELWVFEAQKGGFHKIKFKEWIYKYDYHFDVVNIKESRIHTAKFLERESELLGRKYDFFGLIKFGFVRMIERLFKVDLKMKTNNKRVYCSEAVSIVFGLKCDDITPNELYKKLVK